MVATSNEESFLRNNNNKDQFIKLLSHELAFNGFNTLLSIGDADVLIVKTTINFCSNQSIVVYADDTVILVLLMYHTKPHHHNLYFGTKFGKKLTTWKIQDLCEAEKISPFRLFTHAWRRFDTTSVIHNKGEVYFNPYFLYILHLLYTHKSFISGVLL